MKKVYPKIVISVIISTLLIGVYLVIDRHNNNLFLKRVECANVCGELHDRRKRDYTAETILWWKYVYNQEMNTCLYAETGTALSVEFETKIISCLTNQVILDERDTPAGVWEEKAAEYVGI